MPNHSHDFKVWPFSDAVNTATYCTSKVAHLRFPVLQVSHDCDGDWQFLDATTETPSECVLLCLGCIYERDATLAEISDLPRGWGAYRSAVGAPWERWEDLQEEDEQEEKALSDIERYGLHVISVSESDELPPFSYSIGIGRSLGLPELIVIGLKYEVAQAAINECYSQMKSGIQVTPGMSVAGLLGGDFECLIGEVSSANLREYMGWATWLYGKDGFKAYQIIFPSTTGAFPWESEASEWFKKWQPLLA